MFANEHSSQYPPSRAKHWQLILTVRHECAVSVHYQFAAPGSTCMWQPNPFPYHPLPLPSPFPSSPDISLCSSPFLLPPYRLLLFLSSLYPRYVPCQCSIVSLSFLRPPSLPPPAAPCATLSVWSQPWGSWSSQRLLSRSPCLSNVLPVYRASKLPVTSTILAQVLPLLWQYLLELLFPLLCNVIARSTAR